MADRIYWDSDAFLAFLQNESGKAEKCAGTLRSAEAGEIYIYTSTLALTEVLWMKGAPKLTEDKAETLNRFLRRSCFRVRGLTRRIAENAQGLVWRDNIKPKDAVHVATALDAQAVRLETFDAALIKKSGTVGTPPLTICEPLLPKQGSLLV